MLLTLITIHDMNMHVPRILHVSVLCMLVFFNCWASLAQL